MDNVLTAVAFLKLGLIACRYVKSVSLIKAQKQQPGPSPTVCRRPGVCTAAGAGTCDRQARSPSAALPFHPDLRP